MSKYDGCNIVECVTVEEAPVATRVKRGALSFIMRLTVALCIIAAFLILKNIKADWAEEGVDFIKSAVSYDIFDYFDDSADAHENA